jgi:hypothetical protein
MLNQQFIEPVDHSAIQTKTKKQPKKEPKKRKPKNQYDKNIFANITHIILNKMLT